MKSNGYSASMQEANTPKTTPRRKNPLARWAPLAILLAGIMAIYASGAHEYLSLAVIAENRDALLQFVRDHYVAAILAYSLIYVATVAFSLPGAALLTILGAFLFGWFAGGLITVVSATIGATAIFLIAQSSVGDSLVRKAGPWAKSFSDGFARDAFNYLLFLRLVPVFPFWLVNIAPALFKVRLATFVWATFIGIIPGTFAFSIVGSGLDSIIASQQASYDACIAEKGKQACSFTLDASALITPQLLAGFAALGAVALIPIIVKRIRAAKTPAN